MEANLVKRTVGFCVCLMLFCATSSAVNVNVEYEWVNVTSSAAWNPRDGAGALTYDGKMWMIGGWGPSTLYPRTTTNEVWNSTDGATWTQVKPNTFLDGSFDPISDWEGRHTAGYAVYDNKMWIIGGDANQGHYQNDVWNSTDGTNWTYVNPSNPVPWGPRALHNTMVFNNKIWVMGGQTMPGFVAGPAENFHRDIWSTTDGANWTQASPVEPSWSARGMIMGSVVFNNRMWILGGGTYSTPTTPEREFHNDVWSTVDGENWMEHTANAPWDPRQYHSVTVFDDRMWVLAGYDGEDRNDVWYSDDGVNWYKQYATPSDLQARHAASVFVHDDGNGEALWIAAGSSLTQDVWMLQSYSGPTVLGIIDVDLGGLAGSVPFIFDENHPNGTSFPLGIESEALIYSDTFLLNFLDALGQNILAQWSVDENGNLSFDEWLAGGDGLSFVVSNGSNHSTLLLVPEPATLGLLVLGCGVLLGLRRRH
jgi:hypothetical protein